ncbi:carboxypeptidase Y inhibitor [Yamadazyma tenuis]|nr:carboxypeptidase Y inhibitor [Yamadazyma tenuis]
MNLMTISQSLDEAYTKHGIVPEVVDPFKTQGLLTIEYSDKNKVTLGNTLKVDSTQHVPTIQFTVNSPAPEEEFEVSANDKFALVLTDPDAPSYSDKKWSEYCHWIVTDLALNINKDTDAESLSTMLDFSKGNALVPYVGPGPPEKTKKHRYVFLLYKQDPSAKLTAPADRPNWGTNVPGSGVRDWIKKHGGSAQLLAVNFFYAQNEVQE